MTAFILETGRYPKQIVTVYWDNGVGRITFKNINVKELQVMLCGMGIKASHFHVKDIKERHLILKELSRLYHKRRFGGNVRAMWTGSNKHIRVETSLGKEAMGD